MLRIGQDVYDAIVAHARRDHPDEACGVVTGPAGRDRAVNFRPMLNAARSPTFFEFESAELTMRPTTQVQVDEGQVAQLVRLIEALEENDDVQAVHANFDVPADVLERATA